MEMNRQEAVPGLPAPAGRTAPADIRTPQDISEPFRGQLRRPGGAILQFGPRLL